MITSLRNRHRMVVTALAFLVPIVFVSGLMIRRPIPVSDRLPIIQTDPASGQASVLFEDETLWKGLAITTRVVVKGSDGSNLFLELQATRHLAEPDALVYWSESQPISERLPENAILLGKLNDMQVERWSLPERASAVTGYLTLYSLAHRKIVATAELSIPVSRTKGGSR
ncbi:MAG: hypothetical protein MOB07_14215 [Acidobacteria bacterium]|nr:hypothetical protein [Acidobacteriota bacterium]